MTKVSPSRALRTTNGTPRLEAWAMMPPSTEPLSMATPSTACPLANTGSSGPSYPLKRSASTSHASTAPEKNVKPRPITTDTAAHAQNGASIDHIST
jgi:hypothetical protein